MEDTCPLLPSDRHAEHNNTNYSVSSARHQVKRFLASKTGHYSVLALVSLDVTSIFVDLVLQLLTCEGSVPVKDGRKGQEVLGIIGLVFSCLFVIELLASIWVFEWG
jgi:voltage-gated hydrogen channel 1